MSVRAHHRAGARFIERARRSSVAPAMIEPGPVWLLRCASSSQQNVCPRAGIFDGSITNVTRLLAAGLPTTLCVDPSIDALLCSENAAWHAKVWRNRECLLPQSSTHVMFNSARMFSAFSSTLIRCSAVPHFSSWSRRSARSSCEQKSWRHRSETLRANPCDSLSGNADTRVSSWRRWRIRQNGPAHIGAFVSL